MQLQALAMSLGIRDQVHWLGFVMGAAKQQLLQQSDWFVLPSASENFGIAAAEALAAGTPVILSPGVALAAEAAVAGAGWCCSSDPEALAAQLARCLEPPPLVMRQAARMLAASNYSWDSISRNLSTQYRIILAR
jgi:glycosyltransferase involved in cell wall biosynthesis